MASNTIYIASRYSRKEEMREVAQKLWAEGYFVTSTWLNETQQSDCGLGDFDEDFLRKTALTDLKDISEASIFLFFAEDHNNQPPRGGRHVEFGYALGHGLEMWVVGDKENIFHYLPEVITVSNVEEFIRVRG